MRITYPKFEIITPINGKEILKTIEKVGRTCYKSEDKITDNSCEDFVRGLVKRGHEAVIEHYNVTVKITTDRGVTHEIVRHRIASFCQESTRYCNYANEKFGNEITYINIFGGLTRDAKTSNMDSLQTEEIIQEWLNACEDAERHYLKMLELGATPQIARSVLNNSTKTELCVTMNLREWRHFFKLRCNAAAHPQMREIACALLTEFKDKIPVIFDDISL